MATRAACYAGYAFLLLANILSYHATTAFASVPSFDDGTYMPVLGATHAAAFVAVALRYRNVAHEPLGSKAAGFAAVALCIGFALVPGSCSAGVQPGFVAGTVLIGVGQAVLSLLWLSALPMFSYRTSYLFLLGSHAAATALCAIVLQYPQEWYIPITLASLLAACACATRLRVARPIERTFSSQIADVAPLVGKGVLAVGLFALLSGFVTSLSGQPDIDPDLMQYLVLGISACVLVIMSVPALLFRQPFKLESSYRVALPLSALGLLVLPGLTEAVPPAIAGTLATTGYMMCGIVLACTIAEVGKAARIPVMPLFAASDTVSLLCLLAGTEAGALTRVYLPGTNAGFALIGLGTLYLVMLGASWLLGRERIPRRSDPQPSPPPEQDARPSGGAASEPADATRLASAPIQIVAAPEPDLVAAAYGLSDLETTVFKQLLEGRTIARIAQDLYLSPSAVKYHTQKIYRAFDVHTRAELAAFMRQPRLADVAPAHSTDALSPENRAFAPETEAFGRQCAVGDDQPASAPLAVTRANPCERLALQHGLTDRERQTLELLALGETVAAIARALDVSENTVKTYTKRVYRKLDVHSKQDIIDLCREG